jgi:hypothetical protein
MIFYDVGNGRANHPGFKHQAAEVFAVLARMLYPFLREQSPLGIPTDDFEVPEYRSTDLLLEDLHALGQGIHYGSTSEVELAATELLRDPPMISAPELQRLWRAFMILEMIGAVPKEEKEKLPVMLAKLRPAWRVKHEMVLVAGEIVRRAPKPETQKPQPLSRSDIDYCWRHAYAHPDEVYRIRAKTAPHMCDVVSWCVGLLRHLLGNESPIVLRGLTLDYRIHEIAKRKLETVCERDSVRYFAD